jgi:hypothetical protein
MIVAGITLVGGASEGDDAVNSTVYYVVALTALLALGSRGNPPHLERFVESCTYQFNKS